MFVLDASVLSPNELCRFVSVSVSYFHKFQAEVVKPGTLASAHDWPAVLWSPVPLRSFTVQSNIMNGKSIVDLLRDSSNAAQRRQNLTKVFTGLAGAENSPEVFALTLGREPLWQEQQLMVLKDLRSLFSRGDLSKVGANGRVARFSSSLDSLSTVSQELVNCW